MGPSRPHETTTFVDFSRAPLIEHDSVDLTSGSSPRKARLRSLLPRIGLLSVITSAAVVGSGASGLIGPLFAGLAVGCGVVACTGWWIAARGARGPTPMWSLEARARGIAQHQPPNESPAACA